MIGVAYRLATTVLRPVSLTAMGAGVLSQLVVGAPGRYMQR